VLLVTWWNETQKMISRRACYIAVSLEHK